MEPSAKDQADTRTGCKVVGGIVLAIIVLSGWVGSCGKEPTPSDQEPLSPAVRDALASQIKLGMTMQDVRAMLGSPDHVSEEHSYSVDEVTWRYEDWDVTFNRERVIRFGKL